MKMASNTPPRVIDCVAIAWSTNARNGRLCIRRSAGQREALSVLSFEETPGDSDSIQLTSLPASDCLHRHCNILTSNLETLSLQGLHGHTGCLSDTLGSDYICTHRLQRFLDGAGVERLVQNRLQEGDLPLQHGDLALI